MTLIGFGYGLPMGLVDGEAISSVPERSSGSAAGVLNFVRAGSAALAVACYGLVVAALMSRSLPAAAASRVAAGEHGHGDTYAASLRVVLIAMAAVIALLGLVIARLYRTATA
jgi:hypothetical protein